jgi:hypothetical protein
MAMATEGPFDTRDPEGVFVLKPWKDPAALRALEAYRAHCYPELAADLADWIEAIRSGTPIRGGIGARNEPFAASPAKPSRAPAPARRPAKAAKKKAAKKASKKKGKRRG